jgi:hypothetical protein
MTPEQKLGLLNILNKFEEIWFEHACLMAMFLAIEDGNPERCANQAIHWRERLEEMKTSPSRREHRARLQPLIDAIDRSIETQDILDVLPRIIEDTGQVN